MWCLEDNREINLLTLVFAVMAYGVEYYEHFVSFMENKGQEMPAKVKTAKRAMSVSEMELYSKEPKYVDGW